MSAYLIPAMRMAMYLAIGALAGVVYWEICRFFGGRSCRPAKDLSWLAVPPPPPPTLEYDLTHDLWIIRYHDGSETWVRSKSEAEQLLDCRGGVRC